jgi:hypothetical protein
MKAKTIVKLAVDFLMTISLLLLMGYQFWGKRRTNGLVRECSFFSLRIIF